MMKNILATLVLSLSIMWGQNPPSVEKLAEGQRSYAKQCAGCHGGDAHGTDRGPGLTGNRRVRSRTADQLSAFIRKGSPSGMPGFDMPANELDPLVAWIRTLN